jgi:hypothetical protein
MAFCDKIWFVLLYVISPLDWLGLERRHCIWWVWCTLPVVAGLDLLGVPHPLFLGVGTMGFLFVFFCASIILVSALATFLDPALRERRPHHDA